MPEPAKHLPKVTLENLLRLKRHERPSPDFWVRFDREMQERSMRALMEPAPSRWSWLGFVLGRPAAWMSTGATAALVAAFVWQGNLGTQAGGLAFAPIPAARSVASETRIPTPLNASRATPVVDDTGASIQPKFVVNSLPQNLQASNYQKVPTSLAFAADNSAEAEFAVDALGDFTSRNHARSSAY